MVLHLGSLFWGLYTEYEGRLDCRSLLSGLVFRGRCVWCSFGLSLVGRPQMFCEVGGFRLGANALMPLLRLQWLNLEEAGFRSDGQGHDDGGLE